MTRPNYLLGAALAAIFGVGAVPASAAVQTLTLQNPGLTIFQQTQNNPCVIGDPSCNNPAGFAETPIPANTASYDLTSPTYTVGQVTGVIGSTTIRIGIDVNSTTQPLATEHLQEFDVYVNGSLFAQFQAAAPGTNLFDLQQGNGDSDELLLGLNLAGVPSGQSITFRAIMNTATDGREEFFLINALAQPVPEPAAFGLLGVGLLGLGLIRRKA